MSCQTSDLRKTLKYSHAWDLGGIQWIYTDADPGRRGINPLDDRPPIENPGYAPVWWYHARKLRSRPVKLWTKVHISKNSVRTVFQLCVRYAASLNITSASRFNCLFHLVGSASNLLQQQHRSQPHLQDSCELSTSASAQCSGEITIQRS